jgi:hypothetical protein
MSNSIINITLKKEQIAKKIANHWQEVAIYLSIDPNSIERYIFYGTDIEAARRLVSIFWHNSRGSYEELCVMEEQVMELIESKKSTRNNITLEDSCDIMNPIQKYKFALAIANNWIEFASNLNIESSIIKGDGLFGSPMSYAKSLIDIMCMRHITLQDIKIALIESGLKLYWRLHFEDLIGQSKKMEQKEIIKKMEQKEITKEITKENVKEEQECIVCLDNKKEFLCNPCGHKALCESCKKKLDNQENLKCPICRHPVISFIKVYE